MTNKKGHSEDSLSLKLTEAWVSACLPLSAHRNAKLKKVLEEGFRRPLPSADTLANKYADWAYEKKFDKLKQIAREFENFHVMFDETSEATNIIRHSLEILMVMQSTLLLSLKSSE